MRVIKNNWSNKLKGEPAFLLGNGPSLTDNDLSRLDSFFTIGINRVFLTYIPTILLWQDIQIWDERCDELVNMDEKTMLYGEKKAYRNVPHNSKIYNWELRRKSILSDFDYNTNTLTGHSSSGLLAFRLAYAIGCDPIIMLGMDCCYRGGKTDFYGANKDHKPHTLDNCVRAMQVIKTCASRNVYSCSDNKVFTKIPFDKVVDILESHKHNKAYYRELLTRE